MIIGIGLDIVDLNRIGKIIQDKPKFIKKVLTQNELILFDELSEHRKKEFLAGRFACKEAFSKALGTGIGSLSFQDIEILSGDRGEPIITKAPTSHLVHVSISHIDKIAVAQIIIESCE